MAVQSNAIEIFRNELALERCLRVPTLLNLGFLFFDN